MLKQNLQLKLGQKLAPQQIQLMKLIQLHTLEFEEELERELEENPALEKVTDDKEEDYDNLGNDYESEGTESIETDFNVDEYLYDDEPSYKTASSNYSPDDEEFDNESLLTEGQTIYEYLLEQIRLSNISDEELKIAEYLIGNLDNDGYLRRDLKSIVDDLAFSQGIYTDIPKLEYILENYIQKLEPAGVGARNLQECLLLQIDRKVENGEWERNGHLYKYIHTILTHYFEAFTKKHWDKIQSALSLSDLQVEALQREIRKLNPKPGSSMGETQGRNVQQITPDFIVDTEDDGTVTFTLNHGNLPELHVSQTFNDMLDTYRNNKAGMNRQEKEALLYIKEKVDKAQGFIEAIKQRRHTLQITMKAIIDIQRKFFQDGDEADLRPMILKDIADRTGLDISTISRVSNIKYAQTRWGTFPLRFFFTDSYTTEDGEEMSTRKIKLALKEVIDQEDKRKPLSDDTLAKVMKEKGFPIARRTVAKYREQLGLPVARLRKE